MRHPWTLAAATLAALLGATCPAASALTIELDYRFDRGFFSAPDGSPLVQRRTALEAAALPFAALLDSLAAIAPGNGNSWTATFRHPSWSSFFETATLADEPIRANTLKIFVGGSPSNANTLGIADGGITTAAGASAFIDTVLARGQAGAAGPDPTDFGPWGGSIWFNSRVSWYFGLEAAALPADQSDFLTTATHELAHLLGFGEAASWGARITLPDSEAVFGGAHAVALFGGPVPLDPVSAHWAEGTPGRVNGVWQETLMDPTTPRGTRELLTDLDLAGLADIGWQVSTIPEPASAAQILLGLALLCASCRARVRRTRSRRCDPRFAEPGSSARSGRQRP